MTRNWQRWRCEQRKARRGWLQPATYLDGGPFTLKALVSVAVPLHQNIPRDHLVFSHNLKHYATAVVHGVQFVCRRGREGSIDDLRPDAKIHESMLTVEGDKLAEFHATAALRVLMPQERAR